MSVARLSPEFRFDDTRPPLDVPILVAPLCTWVKGVTPLPDIGKLGMVVGTPLKMPTGSLPASTVREAIPRRQRCGRSPDL